MGKFYITNSKKLDDSVYRVISKAGFEKSNKILINEIILNIFRKKIVEYENLFINNKDFVAINGTLIYKEEMGKKGLNNLLNDFNDNIEDIRKNSIGHYVIIIKKGDYINIFCDKYNLYEVFYYIDKDNFLVSNSYFGVVESMKYRELDEFALFEEVLNIGCIGKETIFKNMYKLLGNEVLEINCNNNSIKIEKVEYNRTKRGFDKSLEKSLKENAKKVTYVSSVIAKNFKNIAVEMTGGLDTRTVVAALNSVNANYRLLYGVSKNPVCWPQDGDLKIVKAFSKKYSKNLYFMNWDSECRPQDVSDDFFYKADNSNIYFYNDNYYQEYDGKIPNYPDLFMNGYFGETLKARRLLEVYRKKKLSFEDIIKKYHFPYGLSRLFKSKKVKDEYTKYLTSKLREIATNEYKIPLENGKISLDYFNEVRQIFSRAMDNVLLNYQNGFSCSLSLAGDLALYEPCFNMPFKFREGDNAKFELIKLLDKSTVELPELPFYSHVSHGALRKVDKNGNLLKEKVSLKEFLCINFPEITGRVHNLTRFISRKRDENLNAYKIELKKNSIFPDSFDIDKINDIVLLGRMYSFSVMLNRYYNKHKKVIAIIPARSGSKGIQRKNIRLLAGKPLIAYSIEAALKSKYIDRVVVSTEDEEIAEISKKYGAEVIERPQELAKDKSPTIDTIYHAFNVLEKENYSPDVVVLLQPTSPLRTAVDIDNAIKLFLDGKCESVVSVCEMEHPPYWSLKTEEGYLKPLFDAKYFRIRRQDLEKAYMPNGAIFVSTLQILYKYKSFYCEKIIPYVMLAERSVDIDTEMDFLLAELLVKKYGSK